VRYLILLLCLNFFVYSQSYKPSYQSNPNLNLDSVLSGVKHVIYICGEEYQKRIDNGDDNESVNAVKDYLKFLGFTSVSITSEEKKYIYESLNSQCDYVYFTFWVEHTDLFFTLGISFYTCNNDKFEFEYSQPEVTFNYKTRQEKYDYFLSKWKQLYKRTRIYYDLNNRLSLPKLPTNWTEQSITEYLDGTNIDSLEGIYEEMQTQGNEDKTKYKVAIIKTNKLSYNVLYLSGAQNTDDWQVGEIKAILYKTAIPNFYTTHWFMSGKSRNTEVILERTPQGFLEFSFDGSSTPSKSKYLKIYPINW
jgi:hypothetical protein